MSLFEAGRRGAKCAALPNQEGYLTEAPGANIFVVRGAVVFTPDSGWLLGITRRSAFDLCAEIGVSVKATRIHRDELYDADGIFLTSTAGGIMPARTIDGKPIGGRNGPGEICLALLPYGKLNSIEPHGDEGRSFIVDTLLATGGRPYRVSSAPRQRTS